MGEGTTIEEIQEQLERFVSHRVALERAFALPMYASMLTIALGVIFAESGLWGNVLRWSGMLLFTGAIALIWPLAKNQARIDGMVRNVPGMNGGDRSSIGLKAYDGTGVIVPVYHWIEIVSSIVLPTVVYVEFLVASDGDGWWLVAALGVGLLLSLVPLFRALWVMVRTLRRLSSA